MTSDFLTIEYVLGVTALALTSLAMLPYAFQTYRGTARPHRATWLVWAVLATVSASAQASAASGLSQWFAFLQAGGTVLIALLAIRMGRGAFFTLTEVTIFLITAGGLALWYFTHEPAYALTISISISAMAALPTVLKCYADPGSEPLRPWLLKLAGSLCACYVAHSLGPMVLAYPLYLAGLYSTMTGALIMGRRARLQVVPRFFARPLV